MSEPIRESWELDDGRLPVLEGAVWLRFMAGGPLDGWRTMSGVEPPAVYVHFPPPPPSPPSPASFVLYERQPYLEQFDFERIYYLAATDE